MKTVDIITKLLRSNGSVKSSSRIIDSRKTALTYILFWTICLTLKSMNIQCKLIVSIINSASEIIKFMVWPNANKILTIAGDIKGIYTKQLQLLFYPVSLEIYNLASNLLHRSFMSRILFVKCSVYCRSLIVFT